MASTDQHQSSCAPREAAGASSVLSDGKWNSSDSRVVGLLQGYLSKLNSRCISKRWANNQLEMKLGALKTQRAAKEQQAAFLRQKLGLAPDADLLRIRALIDRKTHPDCGANLEADDGPDAAKDE